MPIFSNGWLRGFQGRRDIKFRLQHGEGGSLGEHVAIKMVAIRQALSIYAPQDIFNCDETSLYWRLPIWFIGTAKKLRAFTAVGINIKSLGYIQRSNKKAWMTADIFKEWLFWLNTRMHTNGRKVALLIDNFSAYKSAYKEIGLQL